MQLDQLGPYRIGRQIGRGGMGTVYQGTNLETGQPAAIKVLSPRLAVEEGFRDRFETEIATLKKLKHPNIVRLYGFGEQDGHLYYAMELVEGTNLEDELQAGRRFNWRETTQIGIKLARALKHAHDHGVIHRDLKPANLLLTPDDDVKLADFGIARLFGNTRLTSDGGLIGTAEYMAPEQADGRPVTYQCDLYSLGGVLFALLAGRPPFTGARSPNCSSIIAIRSRRACRAMRPTCRRNWSRSSTACCRRIPNRARPTPWSWPGNWPRWSMPCRCRNRGATRGRRTPNLSRPAIHHRRSIRAALWPTPGKTPTQPRRAKRSSGSNGSQAAPARPPTERVPIRPERPRFVRVRRAVRLPAVNNRASVSSRRPRISRNRRRTSCLPRLLRVRSAVARTDPMPT